MAINIFPETGDTLDGALWQKLNKALGLGYQIGEGLTYTDGANADSIYVQPGKAMINGKLVELESETEHDLGATAAEMYHLFLKDDGTLTTTVGTAAPTGEWICLGNVYWNGTDILLGTSQVTRDTFDATWVRGHASREGPFVYRHKGFYETLSVAETEIEELTFDVKRGEMWFVQANLFFKANAGTPNVTIKPACTGTNAEVIWGYIGGGYDDAAIGYGPDTHTTLQAKTSTSANTNLQLTALVIGGSTDGVFKISCYGSTSADMYDTSHLIGRRLYG